MPFIAEEFYRATGLWLHELLEFTLWIKKGGYFHWLLVQRGQIEECPYLIGAPLPRPQPKPSESREESYQQAEGPGVGSREPSAGATAAPAQETPVEESPVVEAPVLDAPCSDTPAPMETGRVGDGQSWAEQVKTGLEAEFRQARPLKCYCSQSRRWEMRPVLPFTLQDVKGRLASAMKLYEHAGECKMLFAGFLVPKFALVWGMVVRGLHVEIFVRVLRSSRVNLNNVNNTNVFCCVSTESPFILVMVAVLNSVLQKQYRFTKCSF